jgi:hypothetical protein
MASDVRNHLSTELGIYGTILKSRSSNTMQSFCEGAADEDIDGETTGESSSSAESGTFDVQAKKEGQGQNSRSSFVLSLDHLSQYMSGAMQLAGVSSR